MLNYRRIHWATIPVAHSTVFSMNFDALRGHSHVLSIAIMNNDPKTGGSHWDPPDALRGLILTHGLGCLGCVELSSAAANRARSVAVYSDTAIKTGMTMRKYPTRENPARVSRVGKYPRTNRGEAKCCKKILHRVVTMLCCYWKDFRDHLTSQDIPTRHTMLKDNPIQLASNAIYSCACYPCVAKSRTSYYC